MAANDDYYVDDDTDMLAAAPADDQFDDADRWDLTPLPDAAGSASCHSLPTLAEEQVPPPRHLDDVERMICHEDFPALLAKASKVKSLREAMDTNLPPAPMHDTTSLMDPSQVIAAVTRMKNAHSKKNQDMPVVRRGTYPITDSMLDESFEVLLKEVERCEQWFEHKERLQFSLQNDDGGTLGSKHRADGGEAIAVKYAKWQTDILMHWMIEHKDHPFPDSDQIKELGETTGLTQSQVVNWTTNVRKRNLKATVEGGKKPHHFVDFVFLAQDRERREAQGLGPVPPPAKKAPPRRKKAQTTAKSKAPAPPVMAPPYAVPESYNQPHDYHQYGAPPNGYDHPYYQQHPPYYNGSYHHEQSHYQHPFPPPPPYGYHSSYAYPSAGAAYPSATQEEDWDHKLGVVSESFDDDVVNPVMAIQEDNTDVLSSFADFWRDDNFCTTTPTVSAPSLHVMAGGSATEAAFEELNQEATSLIKQVDVIVAARLENELMTLGPESSPASDATQRDNNRYSISSMEMIDLDGSNCFLDEFDLKNVTEI